MPQSAASQTCCPPLNDCSFSTDSCYPPLAPRQGVPSPVKRKPTKPHKKPSPQRRPSPALYPPCQSWADGVASVALQSALLCSANTAYVSLQCNGQDKYVLLRRYQAYSGTASAGPAGSDSPGSLQFSVHASTKGKASGNFRFTAPPAVTSFTCGSCCAL